MPLSRHSIGAPESSMLPGNSPPSLPRRSRQAGLGSNLDRGFPDIIKRQSPRRVIGGGTMHETATGAALLAAARDLRPRIIAQRDAIETSRRLPEDLARELARGGFFRIFLPAAYGGGDTAPPGGVAGFWGGGEGGA